MPVKHVLFIWQYDIIRKNLCFGSDFFDMVGDMIESFGVSKVGLVRTVNEDFIFSEDRPFFILADGMGGYEGGRTASRLAVRTVADYLKTFSPSAYTEDVLRTAVLFANRALLRAKIADRSLDGMGTTLVVAAFFENRMFFANVGDSRIYMEADGVLTQLTRDHSFVMELFEAGKISKEDMRNHPKRNEVTRAVGLQSALSVDTGSVSFGGPSKILLCSDGVSTPLGDEIIQKVLAETGSRGDELGKAVQLLTDDVYEKGAGDNLSAILVSYLPEDGEGINGEER